MDQFTLDDMNTLLAKRDGPHVSIYIPTRRTEGAGVPGRFGHCLSLAEKELATRGVLAEEAQALLGPAQALLPDEQFWRKQSDGLVAFLAPGLFRSYRLPQSFSERVAVGSEFLVTPLLPLVSDNSPFFVLALSQGGVRLLRGDRQAVSQVELKGAPRNKEEALATHDVDAVLNYHTLHSAGAGKSEAIFHGQGVGVDDHKDDLLRFFRVVDRALHPVLRNEKAPLVLAAVGYLHPLFRQACSYSHIVAEGISGCPDRLSDRELHQRALPLVEPLLTSERERKLALYTQLAGTGRTARGADAVAAAGRGEVEVLFAQELPQPGDEDKTNLVAIEVLRHGGKVWMLPPDRMPCPDPLAALYWLPHARQGKGPQASR